METEFVSRNAAPMKFIDEPPPLDPFDIYKPGGPIVLVFMHVLLHMLLPTQPGYVGDTAERRNDRRLATMHALAAFKPGDPLEAMLAAGMVAAQARAMECFRRAALPDTAPDNALRHSRQAAGLLRSVESTLRLLQRTQTARRLAEDQPSERSGWWFRSAELELLESERLLARQKAAAMENATGFAGRSPAPVRSARSRRAGRRRPREAGRRQHRRAGQHDPMQSGTQDTGTGRAARPHAKRDAGNTGAGRAASGDTGLGGRGSRVACGRR